jgi:glycerophosphoryl diester phosphodiesterase
MGPIEVASAIYGPSFIVRRLPYRGLAAQIPTRAGTRLLATARNIARIQKTGARVDFWTINDPEEAKHLLAMGADGIMTDDPKALAPLFQ